MKTFHLITLTIGTLALGACGATGKSPQTSNLYNASQSGTLDSALNRAANAAALQGASEESLLFYEELYRRNPADSAAIISYAKALRRNGHIQKAQIILESNKKHSVQAQIEYTKLLLGQGQFYEAEQEAKLLSDNEKYASIGYHLLGLTLDAKGEHIAAEQHLRKALKLWQGNPITVLNNLSLNLAQQSKRGEALAVIDKALAYAPRDERLQKNRTLIYSIRAEAPMPETKPIL